MTVYTGSQASEIIRNKNYPVNSIGICKLSKGYGYWFWDGFMFDFGIESTEKEALRTAKKNWR